MQISRRTAVTALGAAAAFQARSAPPPAVDAALIRRHDEGVERILRAQVTDPKSRWLGAIPDEFGLHHGGSTAGLFDGFTSAYLHPASRFHRDKQLVERMRLVAGYLDRAMSPDGNIDLLITNFNSPPDTAFAVRSVATAAANARRYDGPELFAIMDPFLRRAGGALIRGGVHTPNHRWVLCAALAQLNELYPDAAYVRRIDQWLAEGIDIDDDGQFSERSTLSYNPIILAAFIVMADKLRRPELLEPVRRNLDSMLYLMHPGYEVVTDISVRQDRFERGTMSRYWFPLLYMAVHDRNGRYGALARRYSSESAGLSTLMTYPQLIAPDLPVAALPEDYEKQFPSLGIARIRRGLTSATLVLNGSSRFLALRRGEAVINAVRFATAFFGKAQFIPTRGERRPDGYHLTQSLEGPYYQPLDPPARVGVLDWHASWARRRQTEVGKLTQSAFLKETAAGFTLRIEARGTANVPLAVEINLREGGKLAGVEPAAKIPDAWLLASGRGTYTAGGDTIRFGPGLAEHRYIQVRGAEDKLPGPSVYLTGYTPFDHTIEFTWS